MELVHNDAKTDVLGRALQIIPFIGSVFNHYFCVSAGVREIHDKIHDKQPYANWCKYFRPSCPMRVLDALLLSRLHLYVRCAVLPTAFDPTC